MIWKTFAGICIHQTPEIKVFDNYLFRWLTFNNPIVQTLLNKFNPYKPGLQYINALILGAKIFPGKCCLMGLGGAGAVHALSPFLGDHCITAVESNHQIIEICSDFFMIEKLPNFKIIHNDAATFISQHHEYFEHILLDLFGKQTFPEHCFNQPFFANCQAKLTNNGILAVNLANFEEQKPVFQWISHLFNGSTLVIPIKGCANIVILAGNKRMLSSLIVYLRSHKQLKKFFWDEKWGYVANLG